MIELSLLRDMTTCYIYDESYWQTNNVQKMDKEYVASLIGLYKNNGAVLCVFMCFFLVI